MKKKDFDRAIPNVDQAIRLDPNFASAFRLRGLMFEQKGDRERAIADYRKGAALGNQRAVDDLRRLGVTP